MSTHANKDYFYVLCLENTNEIRVIFFAYMSSKEVIIIWKRQEGFKDQQ